MLVKSSEIATDFALLTKLLRAVFVGVPRNWIARKGGVDSIVIDLNKVHVPINKTDFALGVIVKRLVFLSRAASVP